MDYRDVQKFNGGTVEKIGSVIRTYEENKGLIDTIVGFLFKFLGKKKQLEKVIAPQEPAEPVKPPTTPAVPKSEPAPQSETGQVYYELRAKCFFLEGDRAGGNSGQIHRREVFDQVLSETGRSAQMAGERMHIDITPYDKYGREIGPGDSRHPGVEGTRQQNQYTMDFEWCYDNKVNTNSQDEDDRFALESSWDDYGMTPVLLLENPSPGRKKVTFKAWIKPEHNGGVKVESNTISWYAD